LAYKDRAARRVEVGLAQRERLRDPQAGTPEHNDQAADPDPIGILTGGPHHRDDLLDGGRIRWIPETLVAGRMALVKAREGGRRPAAPRAIEQLLWLHDVLLLDD
jgi:hypothetical protein